MPKTSFLVGVLFVACLGIAFTPSDLAQDKPKDTQDAVAETKIPQDQLDKKNPVAATPDGLAAARRVYKYDCAMCHGPQGDGKGDLVESMKLTVPDWRDAASLSGKTDGELFYVISEGRGKMMGEKDRAPEAMRWNLVNLVRSFSKKDASKPGS